MAAQAAVKGSCGIAPQKAPMSAVSIQPLPVIRAIVEQPFFSTIVRAPSDITSSLPDTAITLLVRCASALTICMASCKFSSVITSSALASTPLPVVLAPASARISDAFPRITANCTSSTRRFAASLRRVVPPAATGSSTTGLPSWLACFPASNIASTSSTAPKLHTSALAAQTASAASRTSCAIEGEPPAASIILAQSLTVTKFVMH